MAAAAPRIKKLLLELGGSDPFIVFGDAKVEVASKGGVFAAFLNAGQVCTSAERFYVEDSIYDEFMEKAIAFTKTLRVGDPMGDVDIGALVSGKARDQVEAVIAELVEKGASVAHGGGIPSHLERGYFFEPTLLEVADPQSSSSKSGDLRAARNFHARARRRSRDRACERLGLRPRGEHLHLEPRNRDASSPRRSRPARSGSTIR